MKAMIIPESCRVKIRAGSGTFLFYLGKVQILSPKKYLGTGTGTGSSSVPRYFTGTLPKYLGTFQVLSGTPFFQHIRSITQPKPNLPRLLRPFKLSCVNDPFWCQHAVYNPDSSRGIGDRDHPRPTWPCSHNGRVPVTHFRDNPGSFVS